MQAFIGHIEQNTDRFLKGKNSLVLHFAGCNFNCPFCNTPTLLSSKEEYAVDLKDIKKQIKENAALVDYVFFTGGEPCLQKPTLIELAKYSKDCGLMVGIATNGSKPDCLKQLTETMIVDYVIFDLKCQFEDDIFQRVTKSSTFFITTSEVMYDLKRSIEILKDCDTRIIKEFRTTIVPGLIFKKDDLMKIAEEIKGIDCKWVIQGFDPENTKKGMYSQINPPSQSFLETIREALLKRYPGLRIEIECSTDTV
jgi:pyruvate formate lyase activating enzyme